MSNYLNSRQRFKKHIKIYCLSATREFENLRLETEYKKSYNVLNKRADD